MSPSDSISSTPKLDEGNFHLWKFKMRMVLEEKDLWGVVDGTEPCPATVGENAPADSVVRAEKANIWQRKNRRAFAIISLGVSDTLVEHIRDLDTATAAWTALTKLYEDKSFANRYYLQRKLLQTKKDADESMHTYLHRVASSVAQFKAIGGDFSEEQSIMVLLQGLDDSWDHFVTALESGSSVLTLDFVKTRLLHEEQKRQETETHEASAMALKANSSATTATGIKCYRCGGMGHIKAVCPSPKPRMPPHANLSHRRPRAIAAPATITQAMEPPQNASEPVALMSGAMAKDSIFVDSGAEPSMSPNKHWFEYYVSISPLKVRIGDDSELEAVGRGTIRIDASVNGNSVVCQIKDVLHVPRLATTLLSVSEMTRKGLVVAFDQHGCTIRNTHGQAIAHAVRSHNLYRLECEVIHHARAWVAGVDSHDAMLWHRRLGHVSLSRLQELDKKQLATGFQLGTVNNIGPCPPCFKGKQHREPFTGEGVRATGLLDLIHADVCGPMQVPSMSGFRYMVMFTDDKSRFRSVYFLRRKDEVLEKWRQYRAAVETRIGRKIKILRSDNGGEFTSRAFAQELKQHGTTHQLPPAYTPQQNGVAERGFRIVMEMVRSMLAEFNTPKVFWAEAAFTAVDILNRLPTKAVTGVTPYEAWTGRKPELGHIRVFGCIAFVHVPKEKRRKLDDKSIKCILLGYEPGTKVYRLYEPITRRVIKSRDVIFIETVPAVSTVNEKDENVHVQTSKAEETIVCLDEMTSDKTPIQDEPEADTFITTANEPEPINETLHVPTLRRSERVRYPPAVWWDTQHPSNHRHHAMAAVSMDDPVSVTDALSRADARQWERAMRDEYESIMKNHTWDLVTLPPGRKTVSCKWVFKTKCNAQGQVERYKARLVARGFTQVHGVDYNETFAPVSKMASIRTLLAIAAVEDLEVHQMDVKTAFLHGDLEEEVYMDQPEHFVDPQQPQLVCKLRKALYGLKQSSRAWYQRIDTHLLQLGFARSNADHSVYIIGTDTSKVIITLYVDDLLLFAKLTTRLMDIKHALANEFDMKDLGEVHYLLGIQVIRDRAQRKIWLSQERYIRDMLKRFGMNNARPVATPMDPNTKLTKDESNAIAIMDDDMRAIPYASAVGSLMHAMVGTRPDLAYAVSIASRYMAKPQLHHWTAVKRIMRYLCGTAHFAITYGGDVNQWELLGYCDADFAGCPDTYKSTSGYTFTIAGGAVSWSSKRQTVVATSTTEAEYMATAYAANEAVWLRTFLHDSGYTREHATRLLNDNQGCIALAKNPEFHARTKHIGVKYHKIRELVETRQIQVEYCPTNEMIADALTKGLTADKHGRFVSLLGLTASPASTSGSVEK
jgi:hypothetical protein